MTEYTQLNREYGFLYPSISPINFKKEKSEKTKISDKTVNRIENSYRKSLVYVPNDKIITVQSKMVMNKYNV